MERSKIREAIQETCLLQYYRTEGFNFGESVDSPVYRVLVVTDQTGKLQHYSIGSENSFIESVDSSR